MTILPHVLTRPQESKYVGNGEYGLRTILGNGDGTTFNPTEHALSRVIGSEKRPKLIGPAGVYDRNVWTFECVWRA